MSDAISSILQTITPYITEMIQAGDESLQYFVDQSGRNLLEENIGKYVADFNQANKGAMDTTYRQLMARGGDTSLSSSAILQREFQTALGRAQAAQSGRQAEQARRDSIHGALFSAGQNAQNTAAQVGSTVYTADKALEGDKYVSDNSKEATMYSADRGYAGEVARAGATVSAAEKAAAASRANAETSAKTQLALGEMDMENSKANRETQWEIAKLGSDTTNKQIEAGSLYESPTSGMVGVYDTALGDWNFGINTSELSPGQNPKDFQQPTGNPIEWYGNENGN